MTQEELAKRANLDFTYISMIERGRRNLTIGSLWRISRALDVRLGSLVESAETLERES